MNNLNTPTPTTEPELISFGSPIYFSLEPLFNSIQSLKAQNCPIAILTDTNVAAAQADFITKTFPDTPILALPAGESSKSLQSLEPTFRFLQENHMTRNGALFVLGGGVLGDFGGFAASSYMRGIRLFQIPTSLLAMVDSAVGAKTAVNFNNTKNLIGSFYPPEAIFVHPPFLETLPSEHFSAAFAEIVKYSLIHNEDNFFHYLQNFDFNPHNPHLSQLILRCINAKNHFISQDPKDTQGIRAFLNLGHTFGHAIEGTLTPTPMHGHAIAVGIHLAAKMSSNKGFLETDKARQIDHLLAKFNLPTSLQSLCTNNSLPSPDNFIQKVLSDKKTTTQTALTFVLLHDIGNPSLDNTITTDELYDYFSK